MMRASNLGILLLVAAAAAAMATDLQNLPPSPDNGMEGGSCLSPDRMADFVEADEYCSEQCARSPPESGEEGESDSSEEDGDDRAPEDLIDYAEGHLCHELCLASELGFTDADDNPDLGAVEAFFADSAAGEIFQSKGVVGQCDNDAEDTAAEGFLESLMARIGEGKVSGESSEESPNLVAMFQALDQEGKNRVEQLVSFFVFSQCVESSFEEACKEAMGTVEEEIV